MRDRDNVKLFVGVDSVVVVYYVLLVLIGGLSITSASYDAGVSDFFALSHFYIKQFIWIGIAFFVAICVLLTDSSFFHKWAYPLYILGILVLIATLLLGRTVNGAKAWITIGSFNVQPVEFVKIATALALARVMSEYSFSITRLGDLVKVFCILGLPLLIIILQNDTGSGVVLCSLIFVLYREGLNKWLCLPFIFVAMLFILSFLLSPTLLLVLLIVVCLGSEMMQSRQFRSRLIYLSTIFLVSTSAYLVWWLISPVGASFYMSLLVVSLASLPLVAVYAYRRRMSYIFITIALYVGAITFVQTTDYIFNSILKPHQRDRIYSYLGIVNDPRGLGYNVNQSKIAIGSGGVFGKGFLNGTQIKYNFVPEKHTDFIFCTVGEEWGLVGAIVVLGLFCLLILKLMQMGERQEEPFGRIYCYSVASIFLFHLLVNVGMTVGLVPVMGIPLPFLSYGGSSLVAFTILLFIAIRLDSSTRENIKQ